MKSIQTIKWIILGGILSRQYGSESFVGSNFLVPSHSLFVAPLRRHKHKDNKIHLRTLYNIYICDMSAERVCACVCVCVSVCDREDTGVVSQL